MRQRRHGEALGDEVAHHHAQPGGPGDSGLGRGGVPAESALDAARSIVAATRSAETAATANRLKLVDHCGTDLAAAAKDNGLEVVSAGPFTRTDTVPGLGSAPEFLSAVFGAAPNGAPDMVRTPTGAVLFRKLIAGADLLIEKPVALDGTGFAKVRAAAEASGRTVSVFKNYRLRPNALRAAAQLIAYELPLLLAVVGVVIQCGTMHLQGIVAFQSTGSIFGWDGIGFPLILTQFVGFFLFLIASQAELTQTPFDMPVAESELVAGVTT